MGDKSRILLVDDDPVFGKEAVGRLRAAGLDVSFHRGPLGTLRAVRASGCELVVIDVNMPKIDAGLLVRMIRDAFGFGHNRVILYSDLAPDMLTTLAKALQVTTIPKSAGLAVLTTTIRAALESPAATAAPQRSKKTTTRSRRVAASR
ncbi:response regulator [Polyangium spumosum]|uniref:Response regulator n=1 Tax=Polyangium spumosum TaxID=889282 RepID=A0A6N7PTW8_9BACT|nr:response regulator [Polyangium spumosum]MRG95433.1 response regulator [Polyangium spumosum]